MSKKNPRRPHLNALPRAPLYALIYLALASLSGPALADPCTITGLDVYCTGNDTGTWNQYVPAGDYTIKAENLTVSDGLFLGTQGGNITFTGNNVAVTNSAWDDVSAIHMAGHSDVTISLENSVINTTGENNRGVAAHSLDITTLGDAHLIINNVQITTSGDGGEGLHTHSTHGNSDITVSNTTIVTQGTNSLLGSYDIFNPSAHGIASYAMDLGYQTNQIIQSGVKITTYGNYSNGLYAQTSGSAVVDNHADSIDTYGDGASPIFVISYEDDITVTHQAGSVLTSHGGSSVVGLNSHGIRARITPMPPNSTYPNPPAPTGNIHIIADGDITVAGTNGGTGVSAQNEGSGNITLDLAGNITNHTQQQNFYGASAITFGAGTIAINQTAGSISTQAQYGHAIYATSTTSGASGGIAINAQSTLTTQADNASGIFATLGSTSGDIQIGYANSTIQTAGQNASALSATQTGGGNVTLTNTGGTLLTAGSGSSGISASTNTGNISITTTGGTITTSGAALASGINATSQSGNIDINASGNITINATDEQSNGISAATSGTHTNVSFKDGTILVGKGSAGIFTTNTEQDSTVTVGANALLDASSGTYGINIAAQRVGTVNVAAQTEGFNVLGNTAGIFSQSNQTVINNAGSVGALSDTAILAQTASVGTSTTINNSGTLTGNLILTSSDNTLNNTGLWQIRKFTNTPSNVLRNLQGIAISNFGNGTNTQINNSGTISLIGSGGQATAADNTGQYAPTALNATSLNGVLQGQILGVKTFTNTGIVDLTNGGVAGDVLVISGGQTAGQSGQGVYVSNGGSLLLNTVLNAGGANSQSDMLVVDQTRLGAGGATAISITNVGGKGALTSGNGIELVQVLDANQSAAGAFTLKNRVVAGLYEYKLYQGGLDNPNDGNWYLRTHATDLGSPEKPVKNTRPAPGSYLGNQIAAEGLFLHTLHDRLGEVQYTDRASQRLENENNIPATWVRIVGSSTSYNSVLDGLISQRQTASLVQIGGDIANWSDQGDKRLHLGIMAGYGGAITKAHAEGSDSGSNGRITGYSLGLYGTWYDNDTTKTGPYIDTWGQYNWFENEVKAAQLGTENYRSQGWALSLETGWAFLLSDKADAQRLIEPQAQIIYSGYHANNLTESNGTDITTKRVGNWLTRLGGRFYGRNLSDDNKRLTQPFIELNWWHSSADNAVAFNNEFVHQDAPHNRYEIKLGLEAELPKNWSLWTHVGMQKGENDYLRIEGLIGAKHYF